MVLNKYCRPYGYTILHISAIKNSVHFVELLLLYHLRDLPTIRRQRTSLCQRSVEDLKLDAQDALLGDTALHWASRLGHITIINLLCDAGVRWDIQNKEGHNAFDVCRNQKTFQVLL